MVEECGHIKDGGGKCGSPALRGKPYCHFHDPASPRAVRAAKPRYFLELPLLAHPGAVQAATREIGQVLADNQIYSRPAARLLYALQFATQEQESGRSASSSRPASPRSIKIRRARGFARVYSTAKQSHESSEPSRSSKGQATSPGLLEGARLPAVPSLRRRKRGFSR